MTTQANFINTILKKFEDSSSSLLIKKGEYLIRKGEVEKYLYYIEKGAVKVYCLSDSEEHILRFGYNGSLINSLSSFIKEEPSELYIEAIKSTTVKRISKEVLMEVVNENEQSLRQYSSFLEILLMQQLDREIDLLLASPSERLTRVLKRSPQLFQYIPLKYIASYLRMTPETISRIRNS